MADSGTDPAAQGIPVDDGDAIGVRIVQAAAAAIVEHGFAGATTDAIARAAKTSKRAIYQRFPDRDALFEQVMAYLCSQAGERPDAAGEPQTLKAFIVSWGYAVLLRFSKPRAQRVLAAAIGASTTFPTALATFWRCGPGVAVGAIAERIAAEQADGALDGGQDAESEARRFILECCGPLVLAQLFNAGESVAEDELRRSVETVADRYLERWRNA